MYISIVTITQFSRYQCVQLLLDSIKNQTNKNIIEWIIIEGSSNKLDANLNKIIINNLDTTIPITYYNFQENVIYNNKLDYLKQINTIKGDILICMDDDDFYLSTFIDTCAIKLLNTNKLCIGLNQIYIHNFISNETYLFNNYNPIIAYKKEIVDNRFNILDVDYILSDYTYIKLLHNNNNYINIKLLHNNSNIILLEPEVITYIMPATLYEQYKHTLLHITTNKTPANDTINNNTPANDTINNNTILNDTTNINAINIDTTFNNTTLNDTPTNNTLNVTTNNKTTNDINDNTTNDINDNTSNTIYDIVYILGNIGIRWSPDENNLGGSEQAVVYLTQEWARDNNKRVAVYGNFVTDMIYNNVDYICLDKFIYSKVYNTIILWRKPGLIHFINNTITAKNIILDLHDNMFVFNDINKTILKNSLLCVNTICVKSEYHKECFNIYTNNLLNNKIKVIMNGVRINDFSTNIYNATRQPYRFCYCSSYDRGLIEILKYVWPHIYNAEKTAELHIYYGMDYIYDNNFKNYMYNLIGTTNGVMNHGRESFELIIREKYLSTFHLYLSTSESEIDCINIRESLVSGCIPIITNFGVFKERHGLQYNSVSIDDASGKQIADDIIKKMYDKDYIINSQQIIKTSNTIVSWNNISKLWF